jgi:hypothetical protein
MAWPTFFSPQQFFILFLTKILGEFFFASVNMTNFARIWENSPNYWCHKTEQKYPWAWLETFRVEHFVVRAPGNFLLPNPIFFFCPWNLTWMFLIYNNWVSLGVTNSLHWNTYIFCSEWLPPPPTPPLIWFG